MLHEVASPTRFQALVAVHLFLFKGEQVLLARRFQTGYEDGKFSVPAGHLDGNETVTTAMLREAREEIGLELLPSQLHCSHVMHRLGSDERIDFFMSCHDWTGEPIIGEPHKCNELRWSSIDELPDNIIPYVKAALLSVQKGEFYSEFGWLDR